MRGCETGGDKGILQCQTERLRVALFENAVFMLSFGRVKTELFKTVTSQHRLTTYQRMRTDLWRSRKGILSVCFLLSKHEKRSLNAAASSCGRGYQFYADKNRCVFNNIRIHVDEALSPRGGGTHILFCTGTCR